VATRFQGVATDQLALSGVVHTSFDSVRAREDAWRVEGVNAVDNKLLVGPQDNVVIRLGLSG